MPRNYIKLMMGQAASEVCAFDLMQMTIISKIDYFLDGAIV